MHLEVDRNHELAQGVMSVTRDAHRREAFLCTNGYNAQTLQYGNIQMSSLLPKLYPIDKSAPKT